MFKNYLKVAARNIIRHKGYSLINILGLAAGMACCILIILYVQFELGYDQFHKNKNRIFRVAKQSIRGEKIDKSAGTPAPMAPALTEDFPEVENTVRIDKPDFKIFVKSKDNWINEEHFLAADSSIFKVFSFPFVKGDPVTALTEPASIVITEEMAKKYFNKKNPIGKWITFKRSYNWVMGLRSLEDKLSVHKVTGVLKSINGNSHFKFNFIIPFSTFNTHYLKQWGSWNFTTYVLLSDNVNPGDLEKKFPAFLKKYRGRKASGLALFLQPLSRIHLYSNIRHEIEPGGSIGNLYLFSAIAFIILLVACINFMNLSTALSFKRVKEVGVRKVLGAGRTELIRQFLGESVSISFLALPLAFLTAWLVMPLFNTITGSGIAFDGKALLSLIPGLLLLTFAAGLISGAYPAIFVSKFEPETVFKGIFRCGQRKSFRSILIIVQFAFSIVFIICSMIGYKQLHFIQTKDLGFDKEKTVQIPIHSQRILDRIETIKNELIKNENIIMATATSFSLSGSTEKTGTWWEGLPQNQEKSMDGISIDHNFVETLGLKLIAGSNIMPGRENDIILNESAAKSIGWNSPGEAIGKKFRYGIYASGQIIGVVKDFHFRSLHQGKQPLVLFSGKKFKYYQGILLKINRKNIEAALNDMKNTWNTFEPYQLFEFFFLDDIFQDLHKRDRRVQRIFQYASLLSIFIACFGLLGLTSLTIAQRSKEIGIRKTFGAGTWNILLMLLKGFSGWVVLANIIAWPAAYFVMNGWLQNFAYRIDIGIWDFISAAVLSLVIALFTVSYRSIKAALTNPVESLRYE